MWKCKYFFVLKSIKKYSIILINKNKFQQKRSWSSATIKLSNVLEVMGTYNTTTSINATSFYRRGYCNLPMPIFDSSNDCILGT